MKFHKAMVMEGFGDPNVHTLAAEKESGVKRTRIKVLSDFRAYRAKMQSTDRTRTALFDEGQTAQIRGKNVPAPDTALFGPMPQGVQRAQPIGTPVDQFHPVADELGVNGEFVTSEESAKIHEKKYVGVNCPESMTTVGFLLRTGLF